MFQRISRLSWGALAWCALGAHAATSPGSADVARATLDNGLRVVVVRDSLAPVVTTEVNYLVGSDEAPAQFPGTAHALEHMMFRGSPGLSKDQLAAIAANMGGSFNADTTQSVTQYFFNTPTQDLDVALRIEAARMRGLSSVDAEWAKERGAIEQEVARDLSSPEYKFYTQMQAQLFEGTPYEHTPLGTRESFERTTGAMLREFHQRWYAPNNALLVIVGDVDPAATIGLVKERFSQIPRQPLPARPTFRFQPVTPRTVELATDSPYGSVYLAYRMPGLKARDAATALVLSQALASQRGALFSMGMDGRALYAGFSLNSMPEAGMGVAVGLFARGADPQPVLQTMRSILSDVATRGVDPELVEAAKLNAIAALEFEKNSVDGLANSWSYALAFQGLDSPDAVTRAIRAVTPAQVDASRRSSPPNPRTGRWPRRGSAAPRVLPRRRRRRWCCRTGPCAPSAPWRCRVRRWRRSPSCCPTVCVWSCKANPSATPSRSTGASEPIRTFRLRPARTAWPTCSKACSRSAASD